MAIDENIPLDEQEEAGSEQGEQEEAGSEQGEQEEAGSEQGEQEEAGSEQGEQEEQQHAASRRETRMQKLANERAEAQAAAKLAQEQAEFYRRQAEALQQQTKAPPVDPVYQDPEEKWRQETESRVNQALFSANDLNDKAAYTLQAAKNPLYQKYEGRVEAQLQQIRAKGGNATREGVLKYLIGEDAVANIGKTTPAAKQAKQRVSEARGSTPGMKSNVSAPKSDKSAEERLTGVIL